MMDNVYIVKCVHVFSTFFKLVACFCSYFPCHSICCLCVDIVVLNCYDDVSITKQLNTIIVAYYFFMTH